MESYTSLPNETFSMVRNSFMLMDSFPCFGMGSVLRLIILADYEDG